MMGFGMGFGWIFSLILIGLGIWFVFQMVQKQNTTTQLPDEDPLDILKKRYARGEISDAEFERMKKDLIK